MRRIGYQNAVLTGIAVLMAIGILDRRETAGSGLTDPATAQAQAQPGDGLSNALEQRKQIIAELRQVNAKLEKLESRLASGLNVKVTDMPAQKKEPEARGKQAQAEPEKPAAPKPTADASGAEGK